ncbi:multidrug resistance efflux pump [Shimia isoporae]|uniref:Multidrug resistance efflux pump n=1 Tax=Shimia isoporae TaxID=647720 RepID=A0A4R1NLD3_9RHOB|nr:biotin/lipoyl-binding protein [Shimia isoporae]TCL09167.1 multidrug resistance efflux pump [Shimia isoporae]
MIEFFLCSLLTILPDFLFRRYRQGKRWGQELTIFTMWYELRWGITSCLILTISLITAIFYYHPSTTNVINYFRAITVMPEALGRVEEVYVRNGDFVKAGDRLFKLDAEKPEAAAATARASILEIDAAIAVAASELDSAEARVDQAEAALEQTKDEFERTNTLFERGSSAVSEREVERLINLMDQREAAVEASEAGLKAVEDKIAVQLPAQRASAEARLKEAETAISKTVVYASVDGHVEQFGLFKGDIVNPFVRPAGVLVPKDSGENRFQAGFGQLTGPVLHEGMLAEITCFSRPFKIYPMVITQIQDVIPTGQFRAQEQLIDPALSPRPGSIIAILEPLYPEQTELIPPGSKCVANAYTNNHDKLDDPNLSSTQKLVLHAVDAVGLVHAAILRLQTLLMPVQTLVLSGH